MPKLTGTYMSIFALCLLGGCDDGYLRGSVKRSPDGGTYLAVVDNNGGECGPIRVDGAEWSRKLGEAAPVAPGLHTIKCGGEIQFEIPAGVVFEFDYWGP